MCVRETRGVNFSATFKTREVLNLIGRPSELTFRATPIYPVIKADTRENFTELVDYLYRRFL